MFSADKMYTSMHMMALQKPFKVCLHITGGTMCDMILTVPSHQILFWPMGVYTYSELPLFANKECK